MTENDIMTNIFA